MPAAGSPSSRTNTRASASEPCCAPCKPRKPAAPAGFFVARAGRCGAGRRFPGSPVPHATEGSGRPRAAASNGAATRFMGRPRTTVERRACGTVAADLGGGQPLPGGALAPRIGRTLFLWTDLRVSMSPIPQATEGGCRPRPAASGGRGLCFTAPPRTTPERSGGGNGAAKLGGGQRRHSRSTWWRADGDPGGPSGLDSGQVLLL